MFHATATSFDDHRVVSAEEWAALRPTLPFGSLPLLEAGPVTLCQSHEIFRHLARAFGWLGQDEARDRALGVCQEALAEAQEDLWRFAWVENYPDKVGAYAELTLGRKLAELQDWFRREGRDAAYWVGESASHVDFIAFCYLDELAAFFPETLAAFPELAAFHERMAMLPGIREYIASGERPTVFGMGIQGPKVDPRVALPPGAVFASPWMEPIPLC
jgi:glutathione S-transferase